MAKSLTIRSALAAVPVSCSTGAVTDIYQYVLPKAMLAWFPNPFSFCEEIAEIRVVETFKFYRARQQPCKYSRAASLTPSCLFRARCSYGCPCRRRSAPGFAVHPWRAGHQFGLTAFRTATDSAAGRRRRDRRDPRMVRQHLSVEIPAEHLDRLSRQIPVGPTERLSV